MEAKSQHDTIAKLYFVSACGADTAVANRSSGFILCITTQRKLSGCSLRLLIEFVPAESGRDTGRQRQLERTQSGSAKLLGNSEWRLVPSPATYTARAFADVAAKISSLEPMNEQ